METHAEVITKAYAPGGFDDRAFFARCYRAAAAGERELERPRHLRHVTQECAYQFRVGPIHGSYRPWEHHRMSVRDPRIQPGATLAMVRGWSS